MEKIIDVSSYQGSIDWPQVKAAGISFAVLRSVLRSGRADSRFRENVLGCRAAGVGFDVYKYSYALNTANARGEAQNTIALLREHGSGPEVTVWWDVEDDSQRQLAQPLLTEIIQTAQTELRASGYTFGIYCNLDWYQNVLDTDAFDCPFWIARYPSNRPMPLFKDPDISYTPCFVKNLWGWQYTNAGQVPGVTGNVDLSILYI